MIQFDDPISIILFLVEVFGCISFATSGAIMAIRKRADYVGVITLTLIEIFGGGLLRDFLLDEGVPHIFYDPEYLWLALISILIATGWFIVAYCKRTASIIERHRHDKWIYIVDAVGVSVFCIYGCKFGIQREVAGINTVGRYVLAILCGVITGVCGGMFRDVFAGEIPMVFKKHFYMMPCLIGCTIYTIMAINNCNDLLSLLVGVSIIILLRTLATIYKWNMPCAKGYEALLDARENSENETQENN